MLKRWILVGVLGAAIGCGDDGRVGSDTGLSDGGTDTTAIDAVGDGGTSDGLGLDNGPDPTPEGVLRTSFVSLDNYLAGEVATGTAIAQFYDQDPAPLFIENEVEGPCEVRTVRDGATDGGFPDYTNVGTITVAGGVFPVSLTFGPGGYMSVNDSEQNLWEGGETLTVTSDGGDLTPFTTSVDAPRHVEITSPLYPLPGSLDVDRGSDLTFTWTGDSEGEVVVRIAGPREEGTPSVSLSCAFDPPAGTGTIPTAALSRLAAGSGTVAINVVSRSEAFIPEWGKVSVNAQVAALRPIRQYLTGADIR